MKAVIQHQDIDVEVGAFSSLSYVFTGAWMEYFKLSVDARKSLLNVVSLPLAGTNLEVDQYSLGTKPLSSQYLLAFQGNLVSYSFAAV